MEARGIHVAIGERCFVESETGRLLSAEVVGFDGGRVLLDGRGPRRRAGPRRPRDPGRPQRWRSRSARNCSAASSTAPALPIDGKGQIRCAERVPLFGAVGQSDAARPGRRAARCRRALDQRAVHGRPRLAARPLRRQRRGQERAAGHDGALYQRRRRRGRADRRARPRGQGIRRAHSRRRGAGEGGRRRRAGQ